MSEYTIRFFWGPRKQNVKSCSKLLLEILQQLRSFDRGFATDWYPTGIIPEHAPQRKLLLSLPELESFVGGCVCRNDLGGIIEDLGYSVSIFSDSYIRTNLRLHVGGFSEYVRNSLTLSLPSNSGFGKGIFKADRLIELFTALIPLIEPSQADVFSLALLEKLEADYNSTPDFGWLTYLPNKIVRKVVPPNITSVTLEGHGQIFLLTKQRLNPENARHLSAARELKAWLSS